MIRSWAIPPRKGRSTYHCAVSQALTAQEKAPADDRGLATPREPVPVAAPAKALVDVAADAPDVCDEPDPDGT